MTPFFSIIVVCFNAGDKLISTVNSILCQSCGDFEIIVKDAGSKDGSTQKLPSDARIRLYAGKDAGIYDGMNQALSHAGGRYVYFLNCGDSLHDPQVLEKVKAAIQSAETPGSAGAAQGAGTPEGAGNPEGGMIFYGDVIEMRTGQRVAANPEMDHFAMYRYLPCHQACFYDRALFLERQFNIELKVRADYEHFLWCIIRKKAGAAVMPLVIADYEGGGYSESEEGRRLSGKEHREIAKEYFAASERFLYRLYLIVSLQPLREKLANGRYTAAVYDRIKNAVYERRR